jgi:hypothetical protein
MSAVRDARPNTRCSRPLRAQDRVHFDSFRQRAAAAELFRWAALRDQRTLRSIHTNPTHLRTVDLLTANVSCDTVRIDNVSFEVVPCLMSQ